MLINQDGIIAAPATIPGTGAVSIVRISGKGTLSLIDRVVRFASSDASSTPGGRIKFGRIFSDGDLVDEVLVAVYKAPHSYTGEDSAEIFCHASSFIVEEIMRLLCKEGARMAKAGEFTERAFLNGKMDLAQAEAVADVISASGKASLKVAMNQLRGGYSGKLSKLRDRLVEIAALMELELDFSEEDVVFADRNSLKTLIQDTLTHIRSLGESFKAGNAIKNGIPVAIAGAVNAGKSTLLNTLLEEDRALVSPVAGTTRDTIEETLVLGGIKFRLTDTAGMRKSAKAVEKMGIEKTFRTISKASIILGTVDVSAPEEKIQNGLKGIFEQYEPSEQRLVILLNKIDKIPANKNVTINNYIVSFIGNKEDIRIIPISAKEGTGIEELKEELVKIGTKLTATGEDTIVTNLRHYNALASAADSLEKVERGVNAGLSPDLLSPDLRLALWHIGSITGSVTTDEILGNIFERFCIGK